jgi:hypothetical protein
VAEEIGPQANLASHGEPLAHLPDDGSAVLKLPEDADLHVIHEKSGPIEIDSFTDGLGDF